MSLELLNRGKEPGCLSAWQVSRLALGLPAGRAAEHADDCSLCAQRLASETKQVASAAFERVPAALLTGGRRSWRLFGPRADRGLWLAISGAVLLSGALAWLGGRGL